MTTTPSLQPALTAYRQEMETELASIVAYWQQHTIDEEKGGFFGKINNGNVADVTAAKGVVLHARILWAFAAAYFFLPQPAVLATAERACRYLFSQFRDAVYGGVFWSVDAGGNLMDSRKQMYGLAFTIYGMSEYFRASGDDTALQFAKELYHHMEQYSFDHLHNGYYEAFARDWQPAEDVRLSAKDANASKTMNTHLHIIEAYAKLYKVWKDDGLKSKIENLLFLFDQHFINPETGHLHLFFDNEWNEQPDVVSYGHDIEAAWLLLKCAETIDHQNWIGIYQQHALQIANAAAEGIDKDGGMWYEFDPEEQQLIKQKHWWPQAEAMIGYLNAWQLSGNEAYLLRSLDAWHFTQQYLLDKKNGEWFWGVDETYRIMPGEDKAGFWKCPYHNARACMEIISRIQGLEALSMNHSATT